MHSGWAAIEREALELVETCRDTGALLRVVGSTGIRLRSDPAADVLDRLQRASKDIDLITLRAHRAQVRTVLEARGYEVDRDMLVAMEGQRYLFCHPDTGLELDVFVDRLEFCHTIDLRHRLDQHEVTISLEDLVLHKLQIVKMTVNDVRDLSALLASHDVVEVDPDPEQINGGYIAQILASNWGFHHTVSANLVTVSQSIEGGQVLPDGPEQLQALANISALQGYMETTPKTLSWRLRSRIGERIQWWQAVDDERGTY